MCQTTTVCVCVYFRFFVVALLHFCEVDGTGPNESSRIIHKQNITTKRGIFRVVFFSREMFWYSTPISFTDTHTHKQTVTNLIHRFWLCDCCCCWWWWWIRWCFLFYDTPNKNQMIKSLMTKSDNSSHERTKNIRENTDNN